MSDIGVILVIAIGVGVISTIRYRKKMKAQKEASPEESAAILAAQAQASSDVADDESDESTADDTPDSGDSSEAGDAGGA